MFGTLNSKPSNCITRIIILCSFATLPFYVHIPSFLFSHLSLNSYIDYPVYFVSLIPGGVSLFPLVFGYLMSN